VGTGRGRSDRRGPGCPVPRPWRQRPPCPPAHAYRMATIDGAGDFIQALAFSPRGNLVAAVTYHGTVLVYSLADPARPARTATVRSLLAGALYPDGQPQPDETLCATCSPASCAAAFSPDGHSLDRRRRPRGDERHIRARHRVRLARGRLRNRRRRHGLRARRRRLPALPGPRRPPHRAGWPARHLRVLQAWRCRQPPSRSPFARPGGCRLRPCPGGVTSVKPPAQPTGCPANRRRKSQHWRSRHVQRHRLPS